MINCIVRLLKISIRNIKNVNNGTITFKNNGNIKKDLKLKKADILGIYGQNGSGKTALVEAMNILQNLLRGEKLSEKISGLITSGEKECIIETDFYIEFKERKYLAWYEFCLEEIKDTVVVSREKLSYSLLEEGNKWKAKSKLIDYSYKDKDFFKPAYRHTEITSCNKDAFLGLSVAKELSKKGATSFIFSEETRNVLVSSLKGKHETIAITNCLKYFAKMNLYIITNEQTGIIDSSYLLPFNIRVNQKGSVVLGNVPIKLFDTFILPQEIYDTFSLVIKQINIVLKTLIPGLSLEIFEYNKSYISEKETGVQLELLSFRDGKKIALRNESDGIKKIISILSTIIAMYNQPAICLVIEALGSGIFEYLLGELLEVLADGAQGQLIFTSHNLIALEKLNKDDIVLTTANLNNRYIRFKNVKRNNNLRDFYLRGIALGGQEEVIYKETNTYEMQYALRMATK